MVKDTGTDRWAAGPGSTGAGGATLAVRSSGTYDVLVTSAAGCTARSASVTVTVSPSPALPVITPLPQASGIVLLTSSAPTGNQWRHNGVPIAGATGPDYAVTTAAQSGVYSVVVTDANGCVSAPSAGVPVSVLGLATASPGARFSLFPNPARHAVVVRLGAPRPAPVPVVIRNAVGQLVRTLTVPAGATEQAIDLDGLPSGCYVVRVEARAQRLVVE